jgi:uncharacterized protein YhbP (UPF0306 family)
VTLQISRAVSRSGAGANISRARLGLLDMDEALKSKILEMLASQHLMTLATIRPDGFPQATIVNYVHEDLVLYFATEATSQKAGNISLNNKVSAAIGGETQDLNKPHALSLSGVATRLMAKDAAAQSVLNLFRALPQSKRYVRTEADELAVFAIRPVAISLVDYTEGFGKSYLLEL